MGKQLPLFQDKTILPTGKYHISYSEISDFMECSFRHKLKHVDKINLGGGSIHTAFGKALHEAIEDYLRTKKMKDSKEVVKIFHQEIMDLHEEARREAMEAELEFSAVVPDILAQFPEWIDKEFPGWELVEAEHYLFESIKKQTNVHFKGFIDAIIKVPNKRSKLGYKYVIIDWKTSNWGWKVEQKRDFKKQMQLILYKHYWCTFMNVDIKDVACNFVLLKRTARKSDGSRIEVVPVSVGPKAIENALKKINSAIMQMKRGLITKNRYACKPFCPYANTPWCP